MTTCGQVLFFPTVNDGACSPEAKHGFLSGIPLEVNLDAFDTLYADNGTISPIKDQFYNYLVHPKSLGPLHVTLVHNGEIFESQILVIKKPELKLRVDQLNDSLIVLLIDEQGKNVSNNFYTTIEVSNKNSSSNFRSILRTKDLNRKLPIQQFTNFQEEPLDSFELLFSTIAVYDKENCLYIGKFENELKVKN